MNYLLLSAFVLINSFQLDEKIDLKITVTNIKALKGNISVGVYNNAKSFPEKDKEYKTFSKSVTNDTVVFVLQDLAKGDYAIAIYHDVNSDKECNLNFIGVPVEPYGFSKNYKPTLSKPSFHDCEIHLDKSMSTTIKLIH